MTTHTRNRLLVAIAAAVPLAALALPSSAQTRVNQDGRALDANNRVGSDGSNDRNNGIDRRGQTYTGNQVITGNVTGARAFRGPVPYRDANEFSGPVSGLNTDRFIRDSSGAPTRSNPTVNYGNSPTAFYGDARSTPPPPGFRPDAFTGGFFNTGASQQTVAGRNPYERSTAQVFDSTTPLLRPSGSVLDGGVDENNQPQALWASPLSGVVPLNPTVLGNDGRNPAATPVDRFDPRNPTDRSRLSPTDVERMRRELRDSNTAGEDGAASESDANNLAQPLDAQALDGAINARGAGGEAGTGRARGATADRPATGKALPSNALQNRGAAERQAGASDPGVQRRLSVPPAQQSQQYKELQERFSRQQGGQPVTAEQANLNSRLLRNAQDAPADGAAQPGADQRAGRRSGRVVLPPPRGSGAPDAAPAPSTPAPAKPGASNPADAPAKTAPANTAPAKALPAAPAPERPAPLRIKSLAEGVEAEGLRDLLVSAEDLMREGKFTSAIDKYAQAEQVVPNNPLVRLGRAQAEIGATRYGSAERDLREAIAADPALLMGQYDLESFIGRDRLSFVIKDLKQIAATETTSPRPMLLLAYIAYGSTGQEAAASEFLDSAAERAGRPDPLIEAMRLHWSLPATGAAPATPNLNK